MGALAGPADGESFLLNKYMEKNNEEKTIRKVVNALVVISQHIDKTIELLKTGNNELKKETTGLNLLDGDGYKIIKK